MIEFKEDCRSSIFVRSGLFLDFLAIRFSHICGKDEIGKAAARSRTQQRAWVRTDKHETWKEELGWRWAERWLLDVLRLYPGRSTSKSFPHKDDIWFN